MAILGLIGILTNVILILVVLADKYEKNNIHICSKSSAIKRYVFLYNQVVVFFYESVSLL